MLMKQIYYTVLANMVAIVECTPQYRFVLMSYEIRSRLKGKIPFCG